MKSTELIIGNWYRIQHWLFKYVKLGDEERVWGTHWCCPNEKYYHMGFDDSKITLGFDEANSGFSIAEVNEILKMYPEEKILNCSYELY